MNYGAGRRRGTFILWRGGSDGAQTFRDQIRRKLEAPHPAAVTGRSLCPDWGGVFQSDGRRKPGNEKRGKKMYEDGEVNYFVYSSSDGAAGCVKYLNVTPQ